MGDQLRLESVLINFLTHAAKASPIDSQIKVNITMKVGSRSGKAGPIISIPSSPLLDNTAPAAVTAAAASGGGRSSAVSTAGGGSGASKVA